MASFRPSRVAAVRHRVESILARTLGRVPSPVVERLLARHAVVIGERRLDAQVQWADLLRRASRHRPIEEGSVARARREYRKMALLERRAPIVEHVEELEIDAPHGKMAARLYRPASRDDLPLLVYFHGGGGVIGDLETHDVVCRTFAVRAGVAVLAIDYRLAPEHSYVVAAEDAFVAYRWALGVTSRLRVRADRIAVGGDSRGGKLAAVVCQLAKQHGEPQPRFQMLVYPSTDVATDYPSRSLFAAAPWLGAELIAWFERHALPEGLDRNDPRVSPLLAEDLAGLAPALVVVAGFDPLRDEGLAYAARLREAGVAVAVRDEPTLPHGFIQLTGVSRAAARATDELADELRAALV
jgi:acetyl esterase